MDLKDAKLPKGKPAARCDIDGSWAWVVLCATVFNTIITAGQVTSANIYFVIFLQEFKASRSFTAWIPAATSTTLCVAGPLSSLLVPRLGARRMIFLGSLLLTTCFILIHFASSIPYLILVFGLIGIGHTFTICGNLLAISTYFKKRAPLATGITMAGSGIGSMLVGLEIEWAVETYGWRGAMFIQAGVALHMCASGSLIYTRFNLETNKGQDEGNLHESCDHTPESNEIPIKILFTDPLFWLSVLTFLTINANLATMNAILKGIVLSYGLDSTFKVVITTVGIGTMLGRVLTGPISKCIRPPLHLFTTGIICALANISLIFTRVPWAISIMSLAFAFCQGHLIVVWILKIAWIFGQKKMPVVRGYVMFFGLVTSMACPPIAGYTVDLTGNYNIALIMVSSSSLFASICGLVIFYVHHRKSMVEKSTGPHVASSETRTDTGKDNCKNNDPALVVNAQCPP